MLNKPITNKQPSTAAPLDEIRQQLCDSLRHSPVMGYSASRTNASEPLALATLALHGEGETASAQKCSDALADFQDDDGKVGVRDREAPYWTTALAATVWAQRDEKTAERRKAVEWLTYARGEPIESQPDVVGHDTSLIAWPWVLGTHSWVEPTAMAVAALKSNGLAEHARTREAVRLLKNRMLPKGGCNYGNTEVLGQTLRPHLQPSGMCLWALSGEPQTRRTHLTLEYVRRATLRATTPWSFSWGAIGLACWRRPPLPAALFRPIADVTLRQKSAISLALVLLAVQGSEAPLVEAVRKSSDEATHESSRKDLSHV